MTEPKWSMSFPPGISTLPPLNPMRRAPRDGRWTWCVREDARIERRRWRELEEFGEVGWYGESYIDRAEEKDFIGWWPIPSVLP